ncbi:MAG: hypothetical protein K9N55_21195 [Phycisphaerae bacterium]|nr:hypothetical protein [Phycisphaerae bacterium]
MGRAKKEIVEEEEPGAPEWMVTFSDCMTLLLTFFVLLLSFSSFSDVSNYRKMTVSFANRFSSLSDSAAYRSAMLSSTMIKHYQEEVEKGSETPVLQDSEKKAGSLKSTTLPDYRRRKVFVLPSELVFWGQGVILSTEGRAVLADTASFLNEMPNRIVISECETGGPSSGDDMGLQRAWSVVEFLTQQGVKTDRVSISSTSTILDEAETSSGKGRKLQIVLLERNVYR